LLTELGKLGAPIVPVTLNHVLKGKADISEAIYEHSSGTKIIPSSLSIKELTKFNTKKLPEIARRLKKDYDFVIFDSAAGFGEEVKRRMLLGTFVLSAGYYDAYYTKAQKVRQLIKRDFIEAFNQVDVILSPTSPTVPFKFGEKSDDPVQMYLSDIFTVPVNLAGLPAISIPVKGRADKLPVGFQLIGKHWHDSDLFGLGKYYERQ